MDNNTVEAEQTFRRYSESFKLMRASALVPFYDYPALIIDRDGKPKLLRNRIAAHLGLWLALRKLKKLGYVESRLTRLEIHQLSSELAIASGTAERMQTGGVVFDEFSFHYTMRLIKGEWKIVSGLLYPLQD